jgi:hypothetical protein
MTCILAARFSQELLVTASDARVSVGGRYEDTVTKTSRKGPYVALPTGAADNCSEIQELWEHMPKGRNFREELKIFKNAYSEVYEEKLEDTILKKYCFSLDDYKQGRIPDKYTRLIVEDIDAFNAPPKGKRGFEAYFLFGGHDSEKEDMRIFEVVPPGVANRADKHYAISGSGADKAQPVLSDFMQSVRDIDNIPLIDGLHAVYKSMKEGSKNAGVGGTPSVCILEKGHVSVIDSDRSRLLLNVVCLEKSGRISEGEATHYFEQLIENKKKKILRKVEGKLMGPGLLTNYILD